MDPQTYQAMMSLIQSNHQAVMSRFDAVDESGAGMIRRQDRTNGRIDKLEVRADKTEKDVAVLQDCKGNWSLSWQKATVIAIALLVAGALMGTEGFKVLAGLFR